MTLSYAVKEMEAIQQRLDDLKDLTFKHPLDDEATNLDLQFAVKEASGHIEDFIKFKVQGMSEGYGSEQTG